MDSMLSLQGINKAYHKHVIIHDLSIEIHQGDFVMIMGESGSGKTTLLNIMSGFEQPDSGKVFYNEIELSKASRHTKMILYREHMSFVFQHGNLVNDRSIRWNLELPLVPMGLSRLEKEKQIASVLTEVGLDCDPTEKVICLSGGEMRDWH